MTIKTIGLAVDPSKAQQGGAVVRREFESMGAAAIDFEKRAKKGVDGAGASFGSLATRVNKAAGVTRNYSKDVVSSSVSMGKALHDLQAKWDPIFASSMRYEKELNDLNKALKFGVINQSTYNSQLEILGRRLLTTGGQADMAGVQFSSMAKKIGSGRNSFLISNSANQFADMAVQIEMGTNVSRVMGQQLPQLLMGFGALGAVLGTVVAIGIPVANALGLFGDSTAAAAEQALTLTDKIEQLQSSISDANNASSLAVTTNEKLGESYGGAAIMAKELLEQQSKLHLQKGMLEAVDAADKIANKFGDIGRLAPKSFGAARDAIEFTAESLGTVSDRLDSLKSNHGPTGIHVSVRLKLDETDKGLKDLEDKFKVTRSGAIDIAVALNDINLAKVSKDAAVIREKILVLNSVLDRTVGTTGDLGREMQDFRGEVTTTALEVMRLEASLEGGGSAIIARLNEARNVLSDYVSASHTATLGDRQKALDQEASKFEDIAKAIEGTTDAQNMLNEAQVAYETNTQRINQKFDDKASEARKGELEKAARKSDQIAKKRERLADQFSRKEEQRAKTAARYVDQLTMAHLRATGDKRSVAEAAYENELKRIDTLALSESDKQSSRALAFGIAERRITDIITEEADKRQRASSSLSLLDAELGGNSESAGIWGDKTSQMETVKEALSLRVIAEEEAAELIYEINDNAAKRLNELERARHGEMLSNAELTFSSLSDITKGFAGEQSGIYRAMFAVSKGFAIAQSLIKIQQAAAEVLADPTAFTPAQKIANAAIIAAQGAAIVGNLTAVSGKGFQIGGYSGDMASNKVAGVIHGQEYAVNSQGTKRNRATLEAMNRGAVVPLNQGGMKLVIENHGSPMTYRQAPSSNPGEMRVIAENVLLEKGPGMMAEQASDSYSTFNGALQSTFAIEKQAS